MNVESERTKPGIEKLTLAQVLAGAAGYVARLPRGDRAELRRLRGRTEASPPEVFWRIVDRYGIRPRDEAFWINVLPLMVAHPHAQGARPGRVLYRAGVNSSRIERWLRRDRSGALREAYRVLSRVEEAVDWVQLGLLLYFWDHPARGEENRRRLARDYFLNPERRRATGDE